MPHTAAEEICSTVHDASVWEVNGLQIFRTFESCEDLSIVYSRNSHIRGNSSLPEKKNKGDLPWERGKSMKIL